MMKMEMKMKEKLARVNPDKAKEIFFNAKQKYNELEQRLMNKTPLKRFIPSFDTMLSSVKFLQQSPQLLTDAKDAQQKITDAIKKVNGLDQQFQRAEDIGNFIKERKQFLKSQLQGLGFSKELKKLSKKSYYFQAQISEYAETIKNKKKAEKKALELLGKTRLFKDFMSKHSFLARLFPMPDNDSPLQTSPGGFAGLQTRLQVSSFIQQAGLSGPNALSQMQQNIQGAQGQLTELRNKIAQLGGTGGDDLEIPDFKIKSLKTKSFIKRLEYAANFQSQKSVRFFPNTTNVGLTIGYRLNTKSVVGFGVNYRLGLGRGWKHIKLTHEGIQLVSYVDWKIKGAVGLSGGYEQNFHAQFKKIDELKQLSGWQQSGLLGIYRTVSLKTKFFKNTKFRLLWDFLALRQVPKTKALLFRVSYNF